MFHFQQTDWLKVGHHLQPIHRRLVRLCVTDCAAQSETEREREREREGESDHTCVCDGVSHGVCAGEFVSTCVFERENSMELFGNLEWGKAPYQPPQWAGAVVHERQRNVLTFCKTTSKVVWPVPSHVPNVSRRTRMSEGSPGPIVHMW